MLCLAAVSEVWSCLLALGGFIGQVLCVSALRSSLVGFKMVSRVLHSGRSKD